MRKALLLCLAPALLVAAPAAQAVTYPAPGDPGTIKHHPNGKHVTFFVCKTGKGRIRTIQKAIDLAAAGDTVRVCNGTYKGGVSIQTKAKAGLKLIGNVKNPRKVILELKGSKGVKAQNGVIVNAASHVTVSGFWARHYKANGFFALSVNGYTFSHLVASMGGQYGIYAFKSKGGTMSNDEGYYNNDSAFYIGGTPPQTKPIRSILTNDKGYDNVLGYSGTNMRYVTIKNSEFYNNGVGIVPNALKSEPYAPDSHNMLINNRIFWNNYNYYKSAPFRVHGTATSGNDYPVGVGVIVFGGTYNQVTKNQIFGNWLFGAGLVEQIYLLGDKDPKLQKAGVLIGNQVTDNKLGLGGADLNGRDQLYDGEGSGNCFSGNNPTQPNVPADNSSFVGCPFTGPNTYSTPGFGVALGLLANSDHEVGFVTHPHKPIKGITPLVHCTVVKDGCKGQPKG